MQMCWLEEFWRQSLRQTKVTSQNSETSADALILKKSNKHLGVMFIKNK